jgi:hypothetical protein
MSFYKNITSNTYVLMLLTATPWKKFAKLDTLTHYLQPKDDDFSTIGGVEFSGQAIQSLYFLLAIATHMKYSRLSL